MDAPSKLRDISQKCVIAIDGTSASGKGTLAFIIAKRFGLVHCQSSVFYRYLAACAIEQNILDDKKALIELSKACRGATDSPELYTEHVTEVTSIISAIPEVRQNLYQAQRGFLTKHLRVVMDGRDIGTVIAPDAHIKIYVTANLKTRAERRYNQLISSGNRAILSDVMQKLEKRDQRDSEREVAPLLKAPDAIVLDTTHISPEEAVEKLLSLI
ncbi:MAG: (d)CMP kinase [Pseudomonadota bacterium]